MNWMVYLYGLAHVALYAAILAVLVYGTAYHLCRIALTRGWQQHLRLVHGLAVPVMGLAAYGFLQWELAASFRQPLYWPFFVLCLGIYYVVYLRKVASLPPDSQGPLFSPFGRNAGTTRRLTIVCTVVGVLLCIAARLFNFGWNTIIYSVVVVPALTLHIYFQTGLKLKPGQRQVLAEVFSLLANALIVAASVIIPDAGDIGASYAVFSSIADPPMSFYYIGFGLFGAGMFFSLLTFLALGVLKKRSV